MQVPLSPRVSPRALTAGQHDGRPLLALAMRPYAYLLPSRRARSLALALTACGVLLCAAARLVQAGMCWSCGISQPSSRSLHRCLLSRCTWLWTTPFRCAASCSSTRALTARSRGALCCFASRGVFAACATECAALGRVSYLLAGSAPPVVLCGRPCLARSRASIDFCGPACGGDAGSARHWTGGCSSAASTRRFLGHAKVRRLADRVTVSAVWPLGGALAICLV